MKALDNSFSQRLTWVVEQTGKSRAAFARAIGVGDTTLKNYMSGDTEPGVKELTAICDASGALITWLISGIGPRTINEVQDAHALHAAQDPRYLFSRDLVKAVVLAMEEEIHSSGITLSPDKRAELVTAFCMLFKSPDKIEREAMRMMLRVSS